MSCGLDISIGQPYKSEQWAPCHIQTPSRYDLKIFESDVKPDPEVIKRFSCSTQLSMKFHLEMLSCDEHERSFKILSVF